ncbi:MAG: hypothetical protein LBB60_10255 [Desulfovibrio sp.]|jgi:alkyl sulfatase BDS1-like metallo-beta-lactamase superfamily hydrolase|nr:hypothetical protein [Desulfovibrio sp.]
MKYASLAAFALLLVLFSVPEALGVEQPKDATPATKAANEEVLKALPFSDTQDFEDATRGFIATIEPQVIKNASGITIWNLEAFAFLKDMDAPATVNPSLWRQGQINL